MRICLYTETALPKLGGQEMVVDALARQFQALNQEVVVLAPHPRLPLRARDRTLPYPVVRHPRFYSTRHFVGWYRWYLLRLHRRWRFDILHCHGLYPQGYLAALCRARLSVPVVLTSHGGDVHEGALRQSKPLIRRRQLLGVQSADCLVAISPNTHEGYLRWGGRAEQIVTIPNGVDIETLSQPVPRPPEIDARIQPGQYALFLGRLKQRKGVDILLDAWQRVAALGAQLVVAGDGEELANLQQQAQRPGLAGRVIFAGPVFGASKTYLLQNALCTLMPSREGEGFPLVLLESYAAGTPVIGTRVPGLRDLIEPGRTGWLVPSNDAAALGDILERVFQSLHECRALGEQARAAASEYGWPRIARRHLDLYEPLRAGQRLGMAS